MEMEYRDPSKRGRWIIVLGLVLALAAGGGAFYLVNNAQQKAGTSNVVYTTAVVAARDIPARARITADDVVLRTNIPKDLTTTGDMLLGSSDLAVGQTTGVTIFAGQLVTKNLFVTATTANGTAFSILNPNETVGPDSEAWRAVAVTVSDDRAVGGILAPGMKVDVIMTVSVAVTPPSAAPAASGGTGPTPSSFPYLSGSSTKISYQSMEILARMGTYYVMKATLRDAEEITHLQASGSAQFTFLLRPDKDARVLDVSALGETTNRIIQRYGILIPQPYPAGNAFPSQPPIAPITPPPSVAPSGSPDASGGVAPAPSASAAGG
jgi:Flp pilus assembly protein CpaB